MTYDEFKAELDKTPELINDIYTNHEEGYTKHLTDTKKMVVTTMDDYTKNTQTAIGTATRQTHEGYEAKLKTLTGEEKLPGESGHQYLDRVLPKLKYLKDGDPDESAMMKGLRKELNDLKTARENDKAETFKATVNGEVKTAIAGLTFQTPIHVKKDSDVTAYQKTKGDQVAVVFNSTYTAKSENGQLVFANAKGEAQTKDGEPMTAAQIIARDFAYDLAAPTHSQGGTGSINNDPNASNEGYLAATPEAIEKKLAEMGKPYMSSEWEELYRKAMKAIGKAI